MYNFEKIKLTGRDPDQVLHPRLTFYHLEVHFTRVPIINFITIRNDRGRWFESSLKNSLSTLLSSQESDR